MFDFIEFAEETLDKIVYGKKAAAKKSSRHFDKEDRKFCSKERYNRGARKQNHRSKKRGLSKYQVAALAAAF